MKVTTVGIDEYGKTVLKRMARLGHTARIMVPRFVVMCRIAGRYPYSL